MSNLLHNYILDRLKSGNKVDIKIERVLRKYQDKEVEEFDWIIDKKYVMEDMPSEVFEGEKLILLKSEEKI